MSEETSNPTTESTGTETTTEGGENPIITYANGKFSNVGDLEKSYLEAQSFIGSGLGGFAGKPEAYSFDGENFEANDMSNALSEWGADNQLSNDGINSLYGAINSLDATRAEAQTKAEASYVAEQTEILGTNATSRIKNASDWVSANIGAEAAESINAMWGGAKGVEAIEKIMKLSQGAAPTATPAQTFESAEKVKQLRFAKDDYGNRKMEDPKYAAYVREMEKKIG